MFLKCIQSNRFNFYFLKRLEMTGTKCIRFDLAFIKLTVNQVKLNTILKLIMLAGMGSLPSCTEIMHPHSLPCNFTASFPMAGAYFSAPLMRGGLK